MILELLFAERNHVCSVCVANGHCDLQILALKLGMTHVHFPYQYPRLPVDASHERFGIDHNRCILCTRCVRVCDEIEGAHTWDVMSRGVDCRVITDLTQPWGKSESCTGCGKCVQVCPTGALSEKGKSVAEMSKRAAVPALSDADAGGTTMSGQSSAGDRLAGRLLRLPHVVSRYRRAPDRAGAAGRRGLQPAGGRQGVSRRTSM